MSPSHQLSYDVLEWFLQDLVDGQHWLFYDYPVNQLFGVQSSTPDFMVQIHPIGDERDARNYIARLVAFRRKFGQLLEGLELREAKGIIPPKFVIERVLAEMRAFTAVPATKAGLEFYPLEKIIFASDCPFDPEGGTMYPRETLRILDSLNIPKADREMIDYKNLEAVTGVKLVK